MHRSYLIAFALFLLPVSAALGINYRYLDRAGEFLATEEVIARQRSESGFCLYGSALHDDVFSYKTAGYRAAKPRVAFAGSSRSLNVRERFFNVPFYNIGGGMDSVVYARHLLRSIATTHTPDVLLLGIDFWWFQGDAQLYRRSKPPVEAQRLTTEKLFRPFEWLRSGKVSVAEFLTTALGNRRKTGECNIGVQALQKRDGYGPDGSYYNTSLVIGKREPIDGFARERRDMQDGTDHFPFGKDVNSENLEDFLDLIRSLEDDGITVIVFAHPLAPSVYREMQRFPDRYAYVPKLLNALKTSGITFFDFHDPRTVGTSDCEFWDGTHGGDVTYARLLLAIHDGLRDPSLKALFNTRVLRETMKRYPGFFMVPDPRVTSEPEVDFLNIGCPKRPGGV